MSKEVVEYPVVWLQAAACTGCAISLLNTYSPSIKNVLIDQLIPGKHVSLRIHPNIMGGAGEMVVELMEKTSQEKGKYILVVEGAVPTADNGIYGAVGEKEGKPVSMMERVETLGANALAVLSTGTCAAYGGLPAGEPNPTKCVSVTEFFKEKGITTPVINVPGCPPHPDWFVGVVAQVLIHGLPEAKDVDDLGRPLFIYGDLIHENCPRRAYFDEGKFAKKQGDPECLYYVGCKGPITYADCPTRMWNNGKNWCVGVGFPCIGCTQPEFPDLVSPFFEKITDDDLPNIGEE
ncbi:MAG: oxidoreductase [Candidatus Syntrophonatronum acetioxidans]|uniref:Oxidoreductase n=1 Tax=Candidatus Syntrophonatronum acetioxidans TaxID=1795816 RepID=A0A424YDL5_9FIRM|nr:MAG: oxidoreductase [Candidatus Syntrophonatronum acetioxidans]